MVIRTGLLILFLALAQGPAFAACSGTDLMATLAPAERDRIDAAVDRLPYGRGNYWRATKGDAVVDIVGTYHFDDPRHDPVLSRLAPAIDAAEVVLVEAGPEEQARLRAEMARRPDRLFTMSGPTLPERLEEAEWQALAEAMRLRGIPPFLAAKMQPWYVAMLIGIPPCAMEELSQASNGLDARVVARAEAQDISVRALEPYDTVFGIFDAIPEGEQIDMIRTTLAIGVETEDMSATLTAAYFAEDVRATWELWRTAGAEVAGMTPETMDAELARMEEALMYRRNRSWIPVIEAAARSGPVFAAFGALHLSGTDGVLALMEREGYAIERLPF